jgi:hypothetical protein
MSYFGRSSSILSRCNFEFFSRTGDCAMAISKRGGFIWDLAKPKKAGHVARLVIRTKQGGVAKEKWGRDLKRPMAIRMAIELLTKCL